METAEIDTATPTTIKSTFPLGGMTCASCAARVERALNELDGVSEDEKKHAEKDLQKLHDDYISKVDALLKAKEAEIMEV